MANDMMNRRDVFIFEVLFLHFSISPVYSFIFIIICFVNTSSVNRPQEMIVLLKGSELWETLMMIHDGDGRESEMKMTFSFSFLSLFPCFSFISLFSFHL